MNGNRALPLVSVITPAFKHEDYVQSTMISVINQTYPRLEYIIIDDGSPDHTSEKISQLEVEAKKRFESFTFIQRPNKGIIKTLNEALTYANGEYVYFIASDDIASPIAIETLLNFLSKHSDYGLVVGDNTLIDSNGIDCYWDIMRNNVYDKKDALYKSFGEYLQERRRDVDFNSEKFGTYESLIKGNYVVNGPLVRKSILEAVGYFSEKAALEDFYLMLQISKISKIKFLNEPLMKYRWHNTNTAKNPIGMFNKSIETMLLEKEFCWSNGLASEWSFLYAKYNIRLILVNFKHLFRLKVQDIVIIMKGVLYFIKMKIMLFR